MKQRSRATKALINIIHLATTTSPMARFKDSEAESQASRVWAFSAVSALGMHHEFKTACGRGGEKRKKHSGGWVDCREEERGKGKGEGYVYILWRYEGLPFGDRFEY